MEHRYNDAGEVVGNSCTVLVGVCIQIVLHASKQVRGVQNVCARVTWIRALNSTCCFNANSYFSASPFAFYTHTAHIIQIHSNTTRGVIRNRLTPRFSLRSAISVWSLFLSVSSWVHTPSYFFWSTCHTHSTWLLARDIAKKYSRHTQRLSLSCFVPRTPSQTSACFQRLGRDLQWQQTEVVGAAAVLHPQGQRQCAEH